MKTMLPVVSSSLVTAKDTAYSEAKVLVNVSLKPTKLKEHLTSRAYSPKRLRGMVLTLLDVAEIQIYHNNKALS